MNQASNKRKSTVLTKYGVDNVAKLHSTQEKRRATFAARRDEIELDIDTELKHMNADQLTLYKLNKEAADAWLNTYHPLKAPKGNILNLGLVDNDIIYCIMTFKLSRDPQYIAELSRMWTLPGYVVSDGYNQLSTAASEFGLYNIVAYIDLSFENIDDYETIGMQFVRYIQKTKWWIKDNMRMTDASRRQKHLLASDLSATGWRVKYSCGRAVYEFSH